MSEEIAAQERRQRFLGTDFTNEDMAERVIDDFTYTVLSEGELVDGRKTHKIEGRARVAGQIPVLLCLSLGACRFALRSTWRDV
ncbi:MAG: outer membrane lipoprotein-sorting protein [Acidobacteria bacterium]|nr:outer membrane lipoprotein-sorting protein [Acidobacteriota bacterium]